MSRPQYGFLLQMKKLIDLSSFVFPHGRGIDKNCFLLTNEYPNCLF